MANDYGAKHFFEPVYAIEEKGKGQTSEAVVEIRSRSCQRINLLDDVKLMRRLSGRKPICPPFPHRQTGLFNLETLFFNTFVRKNP